MTSEIEEAVARVEAELALAGPHAMVSVHPIDDLRTILTALERAERLVDVAVREIRHYAAEAGEAKGRLEMSEAAGIVDMWRDHAKAAEARATRAEEEIARRDAVAKASWGDQKDQHTDAILAAHPTYTKDFETYEAALAMVGTRHGKYELVNLVNWLLARATRAEGLLEEAGEVLGEALDSRAPDYADAAPPGWFDRARAFLDKLKPADAPSGVTATDAELGPGRNT